MILRHYKVVCDRHHNNYPGNLCTDEKPAEVEIWSKDKKRDLEVPNWAKSSYYSRRKMKDVPTNLCPECAEAQRQDLANE